MILSEADTFRQGVCHILIVEDHPVFQFYYQSFLSEKGCELQIAGSLEQARELLAQEQLRFNLVLLDNQLGDGEGITLVPLLKQLQPYCAVVVISGNTEPEFLLTAFSCGIDDYMIKPVNLELLWQKVKANTERLALKQLADAQSRDLLQWKDSAQRQQDLASHLMKTMLFNANQFNDAVRYWVEPSELFSGDTLFQCAGPDGGFYVLLADAMGHGLAAAVSIMPLIQIFQAMASKGMPLSNIVFEMNRKLNQLLPPDRFVAAVVVKILPELHKMELWNGGLPAVLLLDEQQQVIRRVKSDNMPLGILSDDMISPHPVEIKTQPNISLLMYTDGLIETPDHHGNCLSDEAIIELVQIDSKQFSGLKHYISTQLSKPADDISVCLIKFSDFYQKAPVQGLSNEVVFGHQGNFSACYTLNGSALNIADFPSHLAKLMALQSLPVPLVQKSFTVFTELFLNALEHGVLELESSLKLAPDGFVTYYKEKEQRLRHLSDKDHIVVEMHWDSNSRTLRFSVSDSGAGYDAASAVEEDNELSFGRGISLVKKLTTSFDVIPPGNQVQVVISEAMQ